MERKRTNSLIAKCLFALFLMFATSVVFSSCKNDDEPDGGNIVGKWYWYDDEEDSIDYSDWIEFKADGTLINSYGETMTYKVSGNTITFTEVYEGETDTWTETFRWIDDNTVEIDGSIYVRLD